MCPEKTLRSDRLWLWVNPLRKTTQVACCDVPKKYSSRQLSAFGQYSAKSLSSLRRYTPEKYSCRTASGFRSILSKNPRQPSEIYPGKMFTPVCLRLPFPTNHEASPATCCDAPKKCSSRLPSALDLYWAKSLASLRKCTPAIRLGLSALGCNKDRGIEA